MRRRPLADILRPKTIDEVIGQSHLLAPGTPFRKLLDKKKLTSSILYGPPGIGKTTIAQLIANHVDAEFITRNASLVSIKDIRDIGNKLVTDGSSAVIYMDEIHRLSTNQQDVLLSYTEGGNIILIGATTENPFFHVNSALLSRSQIYQLTALTSLDLGKVLVKGIGYLRTEEPSITISPDAAKYIINIANGDARRLLTVLEIASIIEPKITIEVAQQVSPDKYLGLSDDLHYDYLSAIQGSIQASDADSAVYWLAKALESGLDPRIIGRRLLVSAAEDAFSNPLCTPVAHAAFISTQTIGRPECDILLSQAAIMIAQSPRDKTAANAIWAAVRDIKMGKNIQVPNNLRDCHYAGAKELGHGGYRDGKNQELYVPTGIKYIK